MVAVDDAVGLPEFFEVVGEVKGEVMAEGLVGMVFLVVEGMDDVDSSFHAFIIEAVGYVLAGEPSRVLVGSGHAADT